MSKVWIRAKREDASAFVCPGCGSVEIVPAAGDWPRCKDGTLMYQRGKPQFAQYSPLPTEGGSK